VLADVDSTGILTLGSPAAVSVPTANKVALRAFEGVEGHRAAIGVSGVTGGSLLVSVYGPFGTVAQSSFIFADGFVETVLLPVTGTYTIVFDPQTANATSGTLTVYDVPADIGGTLPFETPTDVTVTVPGQNGRKTFAGVAGHRVSLEQTNFSCFTATTSILDPLGLSLASTCGGTFIDTVTLSTTGTYTVLFNPSGTNFGTTTLTLHDVPPDATGTIAFDTPTVITTTVAGQNARYTFAGVTGHRVALGQNSYYNCFTAHVAILKPDGTELVGVCGGTFIDATVLPVDGTYTVLVDPSNGNFGSSTVTLYDVPPDASGATTVNGAAVPLTMSATGQNGRVTFAGAASQQVTVHITGNTVPGVTVRLVSTDGTTVLTQTSSFSASFNLAAVMLPAAGTYTVVVDPPALSTGGATVSISSP